MQPVSITSPNNNTLLQEVAEGRPSVTSQVSSEAGNQAFATPQQSLSDFEETLQSEKRVSKLYIKKRKQLEQQMRNNMKRFGRRRVTA
jgi:hypothetical protein